MDLSLLKQKKLENVHPVNSNFQTQSKPNKNLSAILHKNKKNLKIHLNTERPSRVKAILSKRTVLEA